MRLTLQFGRPEDWKGLEVKARITFIRIPEPKDPCPECDGTGSEWKKTKSGAYDRRYRWPIGPCIACNGTKERQ